MNPKIAAQARTARLVREATTPVYTTETPVREHIVAVEIDGVMGRFWSHMKNSEVDEFCDRYPGELSDIDHSGRCWCQ